MLMIITFKSWSIIFSAVILFEQIWSSCSDTLPRQNENDCDVAVKLTFPFDYSVLNSSSILTPVFSLVGSKRLDDSHLRPYFDSLFSSTILSIELVDTTCDNNNALFCSSNTLFRKPLSVLKNDMDAGVSINIKAIVEGVWRFKVALYPTLRKAIASNLKLCGAEVIVVSVAATTSMAGNKDHPSSSFHTTISMLNNELDSDLSYQNKLVKYTAKKARVPVVMISNYSHTRIQTGETDVIFETIEFSKRSTQYSAYHYFSMDKYRSSRLEVIGCEKSMSADIATEQQDAFYHQCRTTALKMKLDDIGSMFSDVHFINVLLNETKYSIYFEEDLISVAVMRVMSDLFPLNGLGCGSDQACIASKLVLEMEQKVYKYKEKQLGLTIKGGGSLENKKLNQEECFEQSRLFVSGYQHSGTSITRKLIGNHPSVYDIQFETSLFPKSSCDHFEATHFDVVQNWEQLVGAINVTPVAAPHSPHDGPTATGMNKDTPTLTSLRYPLKHKNFSHVVAKEPIASNYPVALMFSSINIMRNTKVVLMVRNPLDVFTSLKLRHPDFSDEATWLARISYWKSYANQLTVLRFNTNICIQRYEDLYSAKIVSSTSDQHHQQKDATSFDKMEQLFQFLGLYYDEDVVVNRNTERNVRNHEFKKHIFSSTSPVLKVVVNDFEANGNRQKSKEVISEDEITSSPPAKKHIKEMQNENTSKNKGNHQEMAPFSRRAHDSFRRWQINQPVHTAKSHNITGILTLLEIQTICCMHELALFYNAAPPLRRLHAYDESTLIKLRPYSHNSFAFKDLDDERCANVLQCFTDAGVD